jgi:PST family polysaccharide transporter
MAVVKIVLLEINAPLLAFAGAALAEFALSAVGLILVYRMTGESINLWRARLSQAKQLLGVSWPLMLSGVAIMIYVKIDQIMLGEMSGDIAVGIYAAAVRISELWYLIPTAIVASVFPSIVAAKKISEAKYYSLLQQLFALMTGLSLLIAVPVTLFANAIIQILYGDNYAGAGTILAIHIWSAWFVFLGVAQLPWDTTEGLTKLALQRTLLGAVVNVAINLVLLPRYGGIGAAVATLVAYAVSACFANGLNTKTRLILTLQLRSLRFVKYLRHPI